MSLVHICEGVKEELPEGHISKVVSAAEWEGHNSELWLAKSDVVVVEPWVNHMCETGCKAYGKTPMCPPNLPDAEETKELFADYDHALFVRYNGFRRWQEPDKLTSAESLSDLTQEERVELKKRKDLRLKIRSVSDMLEGLGYETLPMSAGHCRLCEPPVCNAGAKCRQPDVSMPALEGMGVHVFKTMARLGHEMHYLPPDYESFSFYSGILFKTRGEGNK